MVRKDMIDNSVGYRGFTIGEAFTGPSRMNDGVKQTVEDVSTLILGKNAYKVLKKAEQGLQSAVSVAKSTIVIRSVIIPVANFSSNVIQLLSYNISPRDIYKGYKEKLVEIETFIKAEKRLRQIESQFETYTDVNKLKGLKAEKDSLEDMISGLSIAPLIEAGMFSSISEGMSEIDSSIVKSEWADKLEAAIDAIPRKLGTVGRYVGMTQDSEIFKLLARATMYGDFLGKSILYDLSRFGARLISLLGEPLRAVRCRIHPVLSPEGDQRDLEAITGLREPEDNRDPPARPTMSDPPSGQRRAQERPGVRVLEDIREQIVDLIEAAFRRAGIAGHIRYVACQLPQIMPDERVPFDPDHV